MNDISIIIENSDIFFGILPLFFYYIYFRSKIYPILIPFLKFYPGYLGFLVMQTNNILIETYWSISLLVFMTAYKVSLRKLKLVDMNSNHQIIKPTTLFSFKIIFIFIILFVIYHFKVVGIPIFGNVVLDRYNIMGSGLFGIPSRSYLYGLPILLVISYFIYKNYSFFKIKHKIKKSFYFFILLLLILILTRIIGGFKSGLLEILFLLIFLHLSSEGPLKASKFIKAYTIPLLIIFTFIFFLASLYSTSIEKHGDTSSYLIARSFFMSIWPENYIFENSIFIDPAYYFLNDFFYYTSTYLHLKVFFDTTYYPTVTHIFAGIQNLDLKQAVENANVVPVTISFIGANYMNFGYFFGLVASYIFGYLFGFAYIKTIKAKGYINKTIFFFLQYMIYSYYIKGNLMFMLFNYGLILLVIFLISKLLKKFFSMYTKTNKVRKYVK